MRPLEQNEGVVVESRTQRFKIRNAVKTLIDGISSVIAQLPPKRDYEHLVPFLAYAYHHEPLGPADQLLWPFKRTLEEMADFLPELEDGQPLGEQFFNRIAFAEPQSHEKVVKELAKHDLSDSEFNQCFAELLIHRISSRKSSHVLVPFELLDFAIRLTEVQRPRLRMDGAMIIRPTPAITNCTEADWVFRDTEAAFWMKVTHAIHGIKGRVILQQEDTLPRGPKFDGVISAQFNTRRLNSPDGGITNQFQAALKSLKESHPFILLHPGGTDRPNMYRSVVEEGILNSVISFPRSIIRKGRAETLMIVLKEAGKRRNIRFFDTAPFFDGPELFPNYLSENSFDAFNSGHEEFIVDVNADHIAWNDYQLRPVRYLLERHLKPPKGFEVRALNEIRAIFPARSELPTDGGRVCSSSDLRHFRNRVFFAAELPIQKVEASEGENPETKYIRSYRRVDQDCLLLPTIFSESRPYASIFRYDGSPIYLRSNVIPIIVEDTLDLYWILEATTQDYFLRQIKMLGARLKGHLRLNEALLKEVILFVPNEAHKAELAARARADEVAAIPIEQRIFELRQEFEDGLRIKKHGLAQPFGALKSRLRVIHQFIERNQQVSADDIISPRNNTTLLSYIEEGINECMELGQHIEELTDETKLGKPELQDVGALLEVVREQHGNDPRFSLEIDTEELEKGLAVWIAGKDFNEVVMNVFQNACEHGFAGMDPNACNIHIDIVQPPDEVSFCLRIRNSGRPFPEDFGLQRYILKSERGAASNGSGLGGFRIHQLMQHSGGRVELLTGDPSYPAGILLFFKMELEDE